MRLTTGTHLDRYEILSLLGQGGMGEVYLAQDTRLRRQVALKLLPAEFTQDEDRVRRFIQEAQTASALNHPNIITIHEVGESEGLRFIVTELIDGQTLRRELAAGRLSLPAALEIAAQIASALVAAHEAGITHRDIKPENIMLRRDGLVKVLDFGLAKLSEQPGIGVDTGAPTAAKVTTDPGTVMGTPQYMSPEQARGQKVDARTDLFSLGVLLYEMIAGRPPFGGVNALEVIGEILKSEPEPLSAHTAGIPEEHNLVAELQRIVGKALRKNREERYQTARDLLTDLKDLKEELSLAAKQARAGQTESNEVVTTSSAKVILGEIKRHKLGVTLMMLIILAVMAALSYFVFFASRQSGAIESIAVLPFINASGNADIEYLSDGMTETLISSLSQLPNLNVKPRSSVFRYKGKETNSQTIGKELKVQAILNGRVVQRGQDISLFVELIDLSLDKVVWSETYNRKQTDLVTLQTDIARDVSGKIKTKVSGEDIAKVTKTYTINPEAYQLYLRGNFYRTKYTEEGYKKGIEYYEKAIASDPNYALAYHGIAAAYDFANGWYLPPREAMPKAKAAALKALALDETLADTHFLLGKLVFWFEWDWATAEREWKRANELDPTYPAYYPAYLAAMGRLEEAVKAQEVVQQRLPLDLNMNLDLALILCQAGRYDQSIEQTRKALELDPDFWWSHQALGLAYERKQQYPEAIDALKKAAHLADTNPSSLGYLGYVYAAAGKKAEAQKVLGELRELSKQRYVSPYNIACIYAGLNDKDQAFEWLERAYRERSFFMTLLKSETVLDNLRPDPRFKDLLRRMNLPP